MFSDIDKKTLDKEYILILVKQNKYDEAISMYIQKEQFAEAEKFCQQHEQKKDLLTKLLEKYMQKYQEERTKGSTRGHERVAKEY